MGIIDESWREPMWRNLMDSLPARVLINLDTNSYVVSDHTLLTVYADDLAIDDVDELIAEWSEQMREDERKDFVHAFSMGRLCKAFRENRTGYSLVTHLKRPNHPLQAVRTTVEFAQGIPAMMMAFRFEKLQNDINDISDQDSCRVQE